MFQQFLFFETQMSIFNYNIFDNDLKSIYEYKNYNFQIGNETQLEIPKSIDNIKEIRAFITVNYLDLHNYIGIYISKSYIGLHFNDINYDFSKKCVLFVMDYLVKRHLNETKGLFINSVSLRVHTIASTETRINFNSCLEMLKLHNKNISIKYSEYYFLITLDNDIMRFLFNYEFNTVQQEMFFELLKCFKTPDYIKRIVYWNNVYSDVENFHTIIMKRHQKFYSAILREKDPYQPIERLVENGNKIFIMLSAICIKRISNKSVVRKIPIDIVKLIANFLI